MWPAVSLSWDDITILWRDLFLVLTWITAIAYLISGMQDLFYDAGSYVWRLLKRWKFRKRMRLSLRLLRGMEQQHIALFVPAWAEGEVIEQMLTNLVQRVEYQRYAVFVGTYPNDAVTQAAVDRVSVLHPHVVKVVTPHPGPTTKADCLNHVHAAMRQYEQQQHIQFDIIAMHDAEDLMHPYEFLVFNYLLPRVDAIQMPILPLPVAHTSWVHWVYADEFVINHMKDLIVRERTSGFVPFAGVGMGFTRRAFHLLEAHDGLPLFHEELLTEDYALSKRLLDLGMHVVFINVVLSDDPSPWYVPLAHRPHFVANWAYFPMSLQRSVRQKSRWITGIAIQEWERGGWRGTLWTMENLLKDRKTFFAMAVTLLGYVILIYLLIYWLGRWGVVPFQWEPVIHRGTPLYTLIYIVTGFLGIHLMQRCIIVTWVYGLTAGLLSMPRMLLANLVNGLAAYRAFSQYLKSKLGSQTLRWDKTHHQEGLPLIPADAHAAQAEETAGIIFDSACIEAMLASQDPKELLRGLQVIRHMHFPAQERDRLTARCLALAAHPSYEVRCQVARPLLALDYHHLDVFSLLLRDHSWAVRANTARALVDTPRAMTIIAELLTTTDDHYASHVLLRTVENRLPVLSALRNLMEPTLFDATITEVRFLVTAEGTRPVPPAGRPLTPSPV